MKKILYLLFLFIIIPKINGQEYFPNNESIHSENKNYNAFINAKIYVTPNQIVEKGTLLIQNGKVIAVGNTVKIPKNTVIVNLEGKSIYPSFIDMYTNFGVENPKRNSGRAQGPTYDTKRQGYYWNDHIKPETNAFDSFKYDTKKAEKMHNAGFGVVGTHVFDGIAQGSGSLITLNDEDPSKRLIADKITNHFSFTKSVTSNQAYPSSLMGSIALLRQMYLDLDWYRKGNASTEDLSLEALINNEKLIQIFTSEDKLNSLRASKIAKDFGLNYIFKGSGNEFERIEEIKKTNAPYIIPINFPDAYDVSNPYFASQLDFADLRMWNQAPSNLKVLSDNGVVFALTTDKLKKIEDFRTNLLKAIKAGFDKTKALESLTTVPASLLGRSKDIGSLKEGSLANFLITSGEIFDKETTIYENWIQGSKYIISDIDAKDIRGNYDLTINNEDYKWVIKGELTKPISEIKKADSTKVNSKLEITNNWLTLNIKTKDSVKTNFNRLTAFIEKDKNISGKAILFNGKESIWSAIKTAAYSKEKDSSKIDKNNRIVPVTFPNLAFGNVEKLKQESLLFKNATVWTNEVSGILKETDVLVKKR